MPASKFAKQTHFYLPNSIFLQTITGEWAEDADTGYTEPDMVMMPDYSTATAAPWSGDIALMVIHDCFDQAGKPCRSRRAMCCAAWSSCITSKGWKPIIAPEMEFYLVARNIDPNQPVEPPMGRSGRRAAARQAYSLSQLMNMARSSTTSMTSPKPRASRSTASCKKAAPVRSS